MNLVNGQKCAVLLEIVMSHFPESYLKGDEICNTFTAVKGILRNTNLDMKGHMSTSAYSSQHSEAFSHYGGGSGCRLPLPKVQ